MSFRVSESHSCPAFTGDWSKPKYLAAEIYVVSVGIYMNAVWNAVIEGKDRPAAHKMRRKPIFKLRTDGILSLHQSMLIDTTLEA